MQFQCVCHNALPWLISFSLGLMSTRYEAAMTSADTAREPIAPWWHTVLVLVPLALGSVASWHQHGLPNAHLPGVSPRLSSYVTVLAQEWCGFLLIWLALKWRGSSIGSFFRDLGLAVGFLIVVVPLVGIIAYLLGGDPDVANIMPKTVVELMLWLSLAATAGFCEELIFRGYLTQQFRAWTGNLIFAILLQGVLFGLAHGYYGKVMVAITVQGWLLGLLAYWRKNLRPGMMAHVMQDGIGGVVAFFS
jgi:membrane protease YdiL (CAAX protease family)